MSSLSDLLPTGGGQNAVDFVASGTLGSGVTVALKADGTVEAVGVVAPSVGSPVVFESAKANYVSATFDSVANKVVIAYQDFANSSYGTAVVGTVSGTSITFGTPVVFESANAKNESITFDSAAGKVVIAYTDNGNSSYGTAIVGTVSGTSITFGTATVFNSAVSADFSAVFESIAGKVIISYRNSGNSNSGTAIVGTVSGTSISFGTAAVFNSGNTEPTSAIFDSTNNKIVISYANVNSGEHGTAIVGTVSGSSITFGSAVVFNSSSTSQISSAFDSALGKAVIVYRDGGNFSYGTAIIGTVSGTSISFGAEVVFNAGAVSFTSTTFDSTAGQVVISYKDDGNLNYGTLIIGTVSGTSISFGSEIVFEAATTNYTSAVFDSSLNKVVIAYQDEGGNLNYGTSVVFTNTSSTNTSFIGITAEAIADTATGPVNIYGGINEAQSGLTIASNYYVQTDGSIATTVSDVKIGQAISATTINMMDLT